MQRKSNNISRKDQTKKVFEKIVNNLQKIVDDGKYEQFLKFQKALKNKYSFNNLILIFSQFPEATHVAGKGKWLKLNRNVRKDAQKIFILAPIPRNYKTKVKVIENGEEVEKEKIVQYNAYRYTYVYDISQTEGDEIPLTCQKLEGNDKEELYEKLKQFSPVSVIEENLELGVNGYYSKSRKEIAIKQDLSINHKVKTLIHELTHCMYDDFDYSKDRDLSEAFVESVTFIVADHFYLDTSGYSFNYVLKWVHGDTQNVIDLGNKIQKSADDFIQKIENFEVQEIELAA
ncbi:MAG: hypothetical protein IJH39_00575 [Clostridia bacterium]|nr:hypothetical protein [Clostridia bacterium]